MQITGFDLNYPTTFRKCGPVVSVMFNRGAQAVDQANELLSTLTGKTGPNGKPLSEAFLCAMWLDHSKFFSPQLHFVGQTPDEITALVSAIDTHFVEHKDVGFALTYTGLEGVSVDLKAK